MRCQSHSDLIDLKHEIHTPVGAILGFAEVLAQGELPEEDRKEVLAAVRKNGRELMRLLDELFDSSNLNTTPSNIVSSKSANQLDLQTLLQGIHVLLVEDSVDNQEIFEYFLKSAGATVSFADDGELAVQQALLLQPDIILMDMQIPKLTGTEAAQKLRLSGFAAPIVILSGYTRIEGLAGCNGHIAKPVTGASLVQEVYTYLQRGNLS